MIFLKKNFLIHIYRKEEDIDKIYPGKVDLQLPRNWLSDENLETLI